jgi:hypothetical protein
MRSLAIAILIGFALAGCVHCKKPNRDEIIEIAVVDL